VNGVVFVTGLLEKSSRRGGRVVRGVVYVVLLGFVLILVSCGGEDTTPTFSLSGSDVTVVKGGQGKAAIAFAFNPGSTDVVTLSLEAPEGITGTFDPRQFVGLCLIAFYR
jgi:hypothetical protein